MIGLIILLMQKSFISQIRKKKLKPILEQKNPQQIAQQKLIEISNQQYESNQKYFPQPDHSLFQEVVQQLPKSNDIPPKQIYQQSKVIEQPPKQISLLKKLNRSHRSYTKPNQQEKFSQFIKHQNIANVLELPIQNQIHGLEVFVGKKSSVNVTNFVLVDNREAPNLQEKSGRYKCPSIIKHFKRNKTFRQSFSLKIDKRHDKQLSSSIKTNRICLMSFIKYV